jgi:hypothetical protein
LALKPGKYFFLTPCAQEFKCYKCNMVCNIVWHRNIGYFKINECINCSAQLNSNLELKYTNGGYGSTCCFTTFEPRADHPTEPDLTKPRPCGAKITRDAYSRKLHLCFEHYSRVCKEVNVQFKIIKNL